MDDAALGMVLKKYKALGTVLDERAKRLWAATEAESLGHGGIACVARATGMSRRRIHAGLRELREAGPGGVESTGRQRRAGAGRKRVEEKDPGLAGALKRLVDPATRGDPGGPLLWTSLSAARLAAELTRRGRAVSERTVNRMLHDLGYSLQSNRKTAEGRQHPDRDKQFRHLNLLGRVRLPLIWLNNLVGYEIWKTRWKHESWGRSRRRRTLPRCWTRSRRAVKC